MNPVPRPIPDDLVPAAYWTWLTLASAVGAALRFTNLGGRDFWFDESCTFIYVHHLLAWPAESNLFAESTNLPYYVLLRGWTRLFGESEAAFRSMSAVASALTVPLLGLMTTRLAGWRAGVLCAALAALHPIAVYYAQEARAYALWMLLLTVCSMTLFEAVRRGRAGWWLAFGALLLFTLHLHYFTVFWAAASVSAVLTSADWRRSLRAWAITLGGVVLLFAPYVWLAILPAASGGGAAWIGASFDPWTAIPHTLWALLPAGAYPPHLRGLSIESPDTTIRQPAALVVASQVLPALILAGIILGDLVRRRVAYAGTVKSDPTPRVSAISNKRPGTRLALMGLTVGPLVLACGYSVAVRPNYLVGRYDLVAWPAAIALLGVLLANNASGGGYSGRWRAAAIVPLMLASLVPLHRLLAFNPPTSIHHARAERLAETTGPGDLVIAFSYDRDYLAYYLHRSSFEGVMRSYPTWLERQVGWVDTQADTTSARLLDAQRDAAALMGQVERVLVSGGQVLLLADSVDPQGQSRRAPLHQLFIDAANARGLEIRPAAAELGMFELRPAE